MWCLGKATKMKIRQEFKLPIRVTAIALGLALVAVVAGSSWIYMSTSSNSKAMRRAEMMGTGVAVMTCLAVAPFWLMASAKVGEERRAAKLAATKKRKDS